MTCHIFSKGRRQGDRRRLQQWASQSLGRWPRPAKLYFKAGWGRGHGGSQRVMDDVDVVIDALSELVVSSAEVAEDI